MTIEQAIPIVIAATTFLVTGTNFFIRKWLQKHRDEAVKDLTSKVVTLQQERHDLAQQLQIANGCLETVNQERDRLQTDLGDARTQNKTLAEQVDDLDTQLTGLTGEQHELQKHQKSHDNRIRRALELEGAIWTQPVMAGTPCFRPLADRRTPIISVLNLKGGVGKTTLTAYLGWALARRGYRVLLVDLDLQGSLSSLFVPTDELARLAKHEHLLLQHFLADATCKKPAKLLNFTLPLPQFNEYSQLVATTDKLAYAELSQTVQWLLRVGGTKGTWNGRQDGRMILRRALHAGSTYKKFDVILLDCPPLINLCCANALAASDFVLTPVTTSLKSIERVTPLLHRVLEVRSAGVNPDLNMLGLVVNNHQEREFTPKEQDLLRSLPQNCLDVYKQPVYVFDTSVPQRVHIRDAESGFVSPEEKNSVSATFEQLAEEFIKQLPSGCAQPGKPIRNRKPIGGAE